MKLDELETEWSQDSAMTKTKLDEQALNTPSLHAKWLKVLINEKKLLRKLQAIEPRLAHVIERCLYKTATTEELEEFGLEISSVRYIKEDVKRGVTSHKKMIMLQQNICNQSDKVDYIESILKLITNRGFLIKSAIDYQKFEAGM